MFMWSDYRSNNASYIVATIHHRPVLRVLAFAPLSSSRLQLLTYGIGLLDKSGRCNYWLWSHLDGSNAIDSSVLSESMHAMPIYRVHLYAGMPYLFLFVHKFMYVVWYNSGCALCKPVFNDNLLPMPGSYVFILLFNLYVDDFHAHVLFIRNSL